MSILDKFIQKTTCEDFLSAGFKSCFQLLYSKIAHEKELDKHIETLFQETDQQLVSAPKADNKTLH